MFIAPLIPPGVVDYLRSRSIFPYSNLDPASFTQNDAGVRVLSLRAGEEYLAQHVGQTDPVLADSLAFRRLPLEHVEAALARMQPCMVEAGDTFYLVWSGKAEVWRQDLYDDEPQKVAELGVGDTFGDEALVTGG